VRGQRQHDSGGRPPDRSPGRSSGPSSRRAPRRSLRDWWRRLSARGKVGYGATAVVTALAVAASLTAYGFYLHLDGNLHVTAVGGLSDRSDYGVQNILILGSQTRDGQGPGFGYDPGTNLSDNLLLVHLDATHTHAIIVSIPRDTLVYEPACRSRFGHGTVPAIPDAIIDGAMNQGGPTCAVATVKDLTHIPIDHFVEFDFNSFRAMVDTVGGVEVCVPRGGYDDPWSRLHISGGEHLITGNQALAFVRTRHGVGDGGDLGRIELQQEFISSLIQKTESQGTLDNPVRLYEIADTATRALTVDPGLGSVPRLLHLAETLRNLHTRNVTFVTMPTIEDPANPNRLLPQQPEDDAIWQLLNSGQEWPGHLPGTRAGQVQVSVLNGAGIPGLASRTAASLRRLGFDVTHTGDAPPAAATTVSYQGRAQAGSAVTLMNALRQTPTTQNGGTAPVTLLLGPGFAGVQAAALPRPRHPKKAQHPKKAPHATASPATAQAAGNPGLQSAVQTRNAAASICSDMPAANPDAGTPP
jgi:LCP family protein required for cell wall assembly